MEKKRKRGESTPLDNVPEIDPDWMIVWESWKAVDSSRQSSGFGPCPVSVQDIVAYLDLICIDDAEERLQFFRLIKALDVQWLNYHSEQRHHGSA